MEPACIPKASQSTQFIYAFWSVPAIAFTWWLFTTIESPTERMIAAVLFSGLTLICISMWVSVIWYRTGGMYLDEKGVTFKNMGVYAPKNVSIAWDRIEKFEIYTRRYNKHTKMRVIKMVLLDPHDYYSQFSFWQKLLVWAPGQPEFAIKLFEMSEDDISNTLNQYRPCLIGK